MREKRLGRAGAGRLAALAAALACVCMLAGPVRAATVTASDVMIRNSGEVRDDNIIGALQKGDKVTVLSKSTDSAGIEWYYVELPNKNTGYVKAEWIDNGDQDVETVQPEQPAEEPQKEEEPQETDDASPAGEEAAETEEGFDDWTPEDVDQPGVQDGGTGTDGQGEAAPENTDSEEAGQNRPETESSPSYDPYTDPSAQYSINFVTEKDGTGNWYIYNYDTDKHIRIGDLDKLSDAQSAAQKSASSAGIWRAIACILFILLIVLMVLAWLYLRRNGGGRPAPAPARTRRQRRMAEEEEDEDAFSYDAEDEEEEPETASAPAGDSVSGSPSGAGAWRKSPSRPDSDDDGEEQEDEEEDLGDGDESYGEDDYDEDDYGDGEDDEEDYDEDEEDGPQRTGIFGFIKNIFSSQSLDDDYEDDEDDEYGDDGDPYGEEDDEEEGESYAREEEEAPRQRKASPVLGRGRQKARSTGARSERARSRRTPAMTFDEALDYPEDADLLSAVNPEPEAPDAASGQAQAAALSDRSPARAAASETTGKNAGQTGPGPAEKKAQAGPDDFFADEDDDMEYSFLSSPRKRSRNRE